MSGRPLFHLLAYDISNPARLRAVARIAESHGVRMQYSLFLLRLTPPQRQQLLAELERVIHPSEDDVRLYPLPARPAWETMGRAIWPEGIWLSGEWPQEHMPQQGGQGHEEENDDATRTSGEDAPTARHQLRHPGESRHLRPRTHELAARAPGFRRNDEEDGKGDDSD